MTYAWVFSGGARSSNVEDPGAVSFPRAGSYAVTFRVTDSAGLTCAPAKVTIQVKATPGGEPFKAHPISTSYVKDGHKDDWKRRPDNCRSCHGADL